MEPLLKSFLFLHIAGGSLAGLSGYAALFAPKGGWLHRRAGMLFVYAMIALGAGAVVVGLARGKSTWLGGPIVFYFVMTGMLTVRPMQTPSRTRDVALMMLGLVAGLASAFSPISAIMASDGAPTPPGEVPLRFIATAGLVNASVLLLGAAGDFRVLRSGLLKGTKRLRRHLWRMCFAMWTATGSFFLGQAQVIPEPLRIKPLILLLAFLPLPVMFYYLWRVGKPSKRMLTRVPVVANPRYELATDALEIVK